MTARLPGRIALALLFAAPAAVLAQAGGGQTLGYQWIEAVRAEDGAKLNKLAADRSAMNSAVLDYQTEGEGAIHVAVKKGLVDYIRFMLALGANANLQAQRDGETPLTLAASADQTDIATILLLRARIDQGNRAGETPLIKAVRFRRPAMVQLLLSRGADADKADYSGKSARMYALSETRFPVIAKALADAPKKSAKPVSGPQLK